MIGKGRGRMEEYLQNMGSYWEGRFSGEGRIWGDEPSNTAVKALALFRREQAKNILVLGSGYGRNTRLFSSAGLAVAGIEISSTAVAAARQFDPLTVHHCLSVMEMSLTPNAYDAIFSFNVLHLFRQPERRLLLEKCRTVLKPGGVAFFAVFSEQEKSFGKGLEVEPNTFESKPGRPVHYYSEADLRQEFGGFAVLECGLTEDRENHGEEGPHSHVVRYIAVKNG